MSDINRVYRRVRNKPGFIINGIPSSALFKDSQGVSVDKDDNRSEDEVILDEERLHKLYNPNPDDEHRLTAILSINRSVCDEKDIYIQPDPRDDNNYHVILKKSLTEMLLTPSQAKHLAINSKYAKRYG